MCRGVLASEESPHYRRSKRSPGTAVRHSHRRGGHGVPGCVQPLDGLAIDVQHARLVVGPGTALGPKAPAVDGNRVERRGIQWPESGSRAIAKPRIAPPLVDGARAPAEVWIP